MQLMSISEILIFTLKMWFIDKAYVINLYNINVITFIDEGVNHNYQWMCND